MRPIKRVWLRVAAVLVMVLPVAAQDPPAGKPSAERGAKKELSAASEEERLLDAAGLPSEGQGLLDLFRARSRTATKPGEIEELLRRFLGTVPEERVQAASELVALGPLAVPGLRQVANDLEGMELRQRAQRLLTWADGTKSVSLMTAAARLVARQKPAGAAEALLAYIPFADNEDVGQEVLLALKAVAIVQDQPDPILVRALEDPVPLRRATAALVLGQVAPSEAPAVEKLLTDPNPEVRLKVALGLAKANHAAAVPVLIDLLTVLPADKRHQVEEVLKEMAGEWAPIGEMTAQDEVALRIRRGAWAAWWANTDGPTLLGMLRKRSLSADEQAKIKQIIEKLGDPSYEVRTKITTELVARGRMILPMLRDALSHEDPEIAKRAQHCIRRIEEEKANHLPLVALRMLAVRKPAGAAEALLNYFPFAEDEALADVQLALTACAQRDGKPDPALTKALADTRTTTRIAAGVALAGNGGQAALPAVRKLLADADVNVRLQVGTALAPRDAQAVPVLIDLMTTVSAEQAWQIHDLLSRLAGDAAPAGPQDSPEGRKKTSGDWAEWWKTNSAKADLAKLADAPQHRLLGYVVVAEHSTGKIVELGRDHKPRWTFGGTQYPVDAVVVPNNRVIVAEYSANKVTERDLKGTIIWQKMTNGQPWNIQRLPNGHTFISSTTQLVEVDRSGKDVFTLNANQIGGNQFTGAYKDSKGQIICMLNTGICARLDASGKQLSSFNTGLGSAWMDLRPNGHIILVQNGGNRVVEYDTTGKAVADFNVANATTATGLPNGNFLVTCNATGLVMETDRRGQMIWEYRTQGPFRARVR